MRQKAFVEGVDPRQFTMFPETLDELLAEENETRFISVFVNQVNLLALGFKAVQPENIGRPSYHPRDMLKLYLYGHLNHIRSSRRLEKECTRNIELIWLLGKLAPDHNTISDFRKNNRKALLQVFKLFVGICVEMELVKGQSICVDGTPIKAVNGMKRATNMELSQKKLEYAKKQLELVELYLKEMDEADKLDQGRLNQAFALDIDPKHLPDPATLQARIAKHQGEIEQMQATGESQILYTDPEARVMPAKQHGKKACYNIQTATDADAHMIVGFEVTNAPNDMNKLLSTSKIAKENLGKESLNAIADKGYDSAEDSKNCIMNGILPDVGFIRDREERVLTLDYEEQEITEEQRASETPEAIQACLHAGVMPMCYENTNLSIEVQEQNAVSCFIRHEDGKVTCPMGKELCFQGHKKNGDAYGSKDACRTCPNRCTDGKSFKTVKFGPNSNCVPVIMYGNSRIPLQEFPKTERCIPYNAFGKVKRKEKQVMLFLRRDRAKQKLRMQVSEHPFGTIKHYDDAGYFLCIGKQAVTAEVALMYTSYNIRRALTLARGTQGLIALFLSKIEALPKLYARIQG